MKKAMKKQEMEKKPRFETNKADFELFCRWVRFTLEYFNLLNWRVDIVHEDAEDGGALAWYFCGFSGKVARIGLAKDWSDDLVEDKEVAKAAFHEVCELLLTKLAAKAYYAFANNPVEEDIHDIIRILENSIFETLWNSGEI